MAELSECSWQRKGNYKNFNKWVNLAGPLHEMAWKIHFFFVDEIKPTSQTSKLKGPNPLESYLKSD